MDGAIRGGMTINGEVGPSVPLHGYITS